MTGPRILITISRTWTRVGQLRRVLRDIHDRYPHAVLVHGNHPKGDQWAAAIWRELGSVDEPWPADWSHGKRGGPERNARMVESNPALCLAFIRDGSAGASGCASLAEGAGIPTVRYTHEEVDDA